MLPRLRLGSLRSRLLGAFLLLSVLPLSAVGVLVYRQGEETVRRQLFEHLSSVALLRSQQIEAWVKERRENVRQPTSMPAFQRQVRILVEREGHPEGRVAYQELKQILSRIRTVSELAEMFLLEPAEGRVLLSTDAAQEGKFKDDRPYFREGQKGPFLQHIYYSLTLSMPVMVFSAPVRDPEGRLLAILVGRADLRFLDRLISERAGLGQTFLVNRFNYFVSDSLGRGKHGWRPVWSEGVKQALAAKTGTALYVNHANRPVVAAYRYLPELGVALVAEVEQAEAFGSVQGLRWTLGLSVVLVSGLAILLALGLTYGITRPLNRLVEAARAIGGGDLAHRLEVQGPNELVALTLAVNHMADDLLRSRGDLEAYNQTLEARVEERTRESEARRRVAEALADVGRTVCESLDPEEVGQRIVRSVGSLFGAKMAVLYRVEPTSQDLILLAGTGATVDWNLVLRRGTATAGLAVERRRPVASTNVLTDSQITLTPEVRARIERSQYQSVLAVPLVVNDKVIGALSIEDREGRTFDKGEIRLAQAFAAQAALALENARLHKETEQRLQQTETLLAVSQTLGATLDLTETMRRIARETARALGADTVGAYLVEPDGRRVRPVAGYHVPKHLVEAFVGSPIPLKGHRLLEEALEQQRPVFVSDPAGDPRIDQESFRRFPHRSALFLPMVVKGEIFGALYVVWWERYPSMTAEETRLAEAISRQAATALENARLYAETRKAYEELSHTQDLLSQAQKLEAIGRLAGGVAHDFNNLLTIITGRSQLVLRRLGAGDALGRDIELIDKTAKRAADLTKQLLAFSRKQVLQPKVLDLNAAVGGIEPMLRRLIGEDIELRTALEPALGRVKADPSQLEQVILNLGVNARDAMPQGGKLTITTANVYLDATYALRNGGVQPGPYVRLAMSDTGCGIDAATQARIFEPFFTTKEKGRGTGLGLATVYGIVKQSGGHIWVYSEPGRGSTFKIYLPRVQDSLEAPMIDKDRPQPLRGSETILLVEDEEELRGLACEILQGNGYTVLSASEGVEALRIAQDYRGPIHLLVTDVIMPKMSGRDLADRLTILRPEARVLYMSGYTDDAIARHGVLEPGTPLVEKPFQPDTLLEKVREVIDADDECLV